MNDLSNGLLSDVWNFELILKFLSNHFIELTLASLASVLTVIRIIKPRLTFYFLLRVVELVFKIQFSEVFAVSEHAILKRILDNTAANRVALIEMKRNGTTEIHVLQEHKTTQRDLKELNSFAAHSFRDLIDDLNVLKGAITFDKNTIKHQDFYQLISSSYNCTSFALIPIYQNDVAHHVVVTLIAFDNYKIFDKKLLHFVTIQASKVAKISYLMR